MKELAVVRSISTKEGDHARASYLLHTGRVPQEPLQYPTFGSLISKELGDPKADCRTTSASVGRGAGSAQLRYSAGLRPLLVGANPDGPNGRRPGVRDLAVQTSSQRSIRPAPNDA